MVPLRRNRWRARSSIGGARETGVRVAAEGCIHEGNTAG